jgi:uncharacterized lipoprotein
VVVSTKPLTLATLIALLSACSSDPRTQAKRAADAYIKKGNHPDLLKRSVTVTESGRQWVVTYHVPEGYAGGDCVFSVDKRTMKVLGSVCGQ